MHRRQTAQPASPSLPRLLRLPEVKAITGLGTDTIYRLGREGSFPRARKISERASGWREDELRAWMDSLEEIDHNAPSTAPAIAAAAKLRARKRRGTA